MTEPSAASEAADLRSGKGHKDENFPVASFVLKPVHRAPILAFYRFARTADDVADHAAASAEEKLELLEDMRATLSGERNASPEALPASPSCETTVPLRRTSPEVVCLCSS